MDIADRTSNRCLLLPGRYLIAELLIRHSEGTIMADSDHMDKKDTCSAQELGNPVLRVGSRLLQNAYTGGDVLLLRAGHEIRDTAELNRLLQADVTFGPDRSKVIPIDLDNENNISEYDTNISGLNERVQHAATIKAEVVKDVRRVFGRIQSTGETDLEAAQNAVASLVSDMMEDPRAMVSLAQLKNVDAYTFTHSVNVSILAIYLAMKTNHRASFQEIGVGALLHDVGKTRTPSKVLHKQGPLSPFEMLIMKQHPVIGAELLEKSGVTCKLTLSCVRDHHEKVNGLGYPNGKAGKEISTYAMITSLADIYDALTTDRPYRKAMNPRDAMLIMTEKMKMELDPLLLQRFVSAIGYFPVGSHVKLSNGCVGVVVLNHAFDPLRPKVELTKDVIGRNIPCGEMVDLSKQRDMFVKKVLSHGVSLADLKAA